jgi:hypothetical protein
MNMNHLLQLSAVAAVALCGLRGASATEPKSAAKTERIGIYDSRALAYAHFGSESEQRQQKEVFAAAKEAKTKGDTNRLAKLKAEMKQRQEKSHLQVFSTAPVEEVLATIKDHAEEVKKQAGVSRLVSKWDKAALDRYPSAQQVDVTEQLLSAFKLDAKQLNMVADIRKHDPLPLATAKQMLREGKL